MPVTFNADMKLEYITSRSDKDHWMACRKFTSKQASKRFVKELWVPDNQIGGPCLRGPQVVTQLYLAHTHTWWAWTHTSSEICHCTCFTQVSSFQFRIQIQSTCVIMCTWVEHSCSLAVSNWMKKITSDPNSRCNSELCNILYSIFRELLLLATSVCATSVL